MNKKIFVFGDSIAWGACDTEGGWVARLKKDLDLKSIESNFDYYIALYNLSVSGDTTRELLQRFEREISVRMAPNEGEMTVIFAIGINDSYLYLPEKTNEVSIPVFENNIGELYTLAKKYTPEIIFVGLTPVDETVINSTPWMENYAYFNQEVESYNNFLEKFCAEHKVLFIDLLSKFSDYKDLLMDGLHLNTNGHEKMYNRVREILVNNSII